VHVNEDQLLLKKPDPLTTLAAANVASIHDQLPAEKSIQPQVWKFISRRMASVSYGSRTYVFAG